MGAWYALAPRCERPTACVDGPTRRIRSVQIDRGGTEDLASGDVNEDGAAVCQGGVACASVLHRSPGLPSGGGDLVHQFTEPDSLFVTSARGHLEVLQRIDDHGIVWIRAHHTEGDCGCLEHHVDVRRLVRPAACRNTSTAEDVMACAAAVTQAYLNDAI